MQLLSNQLQYNSLSGPVKQFTIDHCAYLLRIQNLNFLVEHFYSSGEGLQPRLLIGQSIWRFADNLLRKLGQTCQLTNNIRKGLIGQIFFEDEKTSVSWPNFDT